MTSWPDIVVTLYASATWPGIIDCYPFYPLGDMLCFNFRGKALLNLRHPKGLDNGITDDEICCPLAPFPLSFSFSSRCTSHVAQRPAGGSTWLVARAAACGHHHHPCPTCGIDTRVRAAQTSERLTVIIAGHLGPLSLLLPCCTLDPR